MGFFRKIENENGLIGIWKLTEKPDELLPQIQLSKQDQNYFQQLRFKKRQTEFLATRLLLKHLFNETVQIEYLPNGKPILTGRNEKISISHSLHFVCVFISEKEIGIDIEDTTRPIDRVANRFLHTEEFNFISDLKNPQLAKVTYWAAKEAVFKCSREQGIQFNTQIRIDDFDPEKDRQFTARLLISEKNLKYRLTSEHVENNVLVYCVEM